MFDSIKIDIPQIAASIRFAAILKDERFQTEQRASIQNSALLERDCSCRSTVPNSATLAFHSAWCSRFSAAPTFSKTPSNVEGISSGLGIALSRAFGPMLRTIPDQFRWLELVGRVAGADEEKLLAVLHHEPRARGGLDGDDADIARAEAPLAGSTLWVRRAYYGAGEGMS